MTKKRSADPRARIREICLALPEATARDGQHIKFEVRGKSFGYYTDDHHGDGRLAFSCKAPMGMQGALVSSYPERFFVPPYLGPKGWIGVWLDVRAVDWDEVAELAAESYRMTAPKRLIGQLGGQTNL
jgi:hypothetical protein